MGVLRQGPEARVGHPGVVDLDIGQDCGHLQHEVPEAERPGNDTGIEDLVPQSQKQENTSSGLREA